MAGSHAPALLRAVHIDVIDFAGARAVLAHAVRVAQRRRPAVACRLPATTLAEAAAAAAEAARGRQSPTGVRRAPRARRGACRQRRQRRGEVVMFDAHSARIRRHLFNRTGRPPRARPTSRVDVDDRPPSMPPSSPEPRSSPSSSPSAARAGRRRAVGRREDGAGVRLGRSWRCSGRKRRRGGGGAEQRRLQHHRRLTRLASHQSLRAEGRAAAAPPTPPSPLRAPLAASRVELCRVARRRRRRRRRRRCRPRRPIDLYLRRREDGAPHLEVLHRHVGGGLRQGEYLRSAPLVSPRRPPARSRRVRR